jgi:hypothetical protein
MLGYRHPVKSEASAADICAWLCEPRQEEAYFVT